MSTREYLSVEESSKTIASEIMEYGSSRGWVGNNQVARNVEHRLSKFNIGLTDPKSGTWSHREKGTRFFMAMNLISMVKSKASDLAAKIKK